MCVFSLVILSRKNYQSAAIERKCYLIRLENFDKYFKVVVVKGNSTFLTGFLFQNFSKNIQLKINTFLCSGIEVI